MSGISRIQAVIRNATRRWRRQRALRGVCTGALVGSGIILLALGLYKLLPLPETTLLAAGGMALLAVLAGGIIGWMRPPTQLETAQWLDQKLDLKERLSTALESQCQGSAWAELVVRDAMQHVDKVNPARLLPFSLAGTARWALLTLALAAGLGFVPEYRSPEQIQAAKDRENIADVGRRLTQLAKHNLQANPPALEPTQKSVEAMMELGGQLMKNPPTRGDALREVAKLSSQIQKQATDLSQQAAIKKLDKAAREQASAATPDPAALQKKIEELQSKLGEAAGKAEALEKLKENLMKAQTAAKNMPEKGTPESDAARQKLAEALAAMNQDAQKLGQNLEKLDEAIKALAEGNTEMFLKDLDLATKDLEKLAQMAKALEQMKQMQAGMQGKIGKDLAEQLKMGQAHAAIDTLQKMAEQVQSGRLTPEQQQQMLKELAQALEPAGDYGDVAQKLNQAAQCLQQGNRAGARENLQAAAKEIQELLERMGDAQALAEAMEALARAEQAIANCQGMGQCFGPPRFGRGGKPGRGVGTWYDDNDMFSNLEERGELWDNSEGVMPTLDARGHTDRDVQKPDNMDPSMVKGKLAPGAPLPSVSLKGVSIKGSSKVEFSEAAAAAQAEAQNALNQDRVPRAYREQVKTYFDDLK